MSENKPGTWNQFLRVSADGYPEMVITARNGCPIAAVGNHAEYKETANLITATPDLLLAGKHLAVKLAEVYRAAGQKPGDCQAVRDWMAAVARSEGRS